MRVLLINLDRSPERLNEFRAEAKRCGLTFERLPAIDGQALSEQEIAAVIDPRFVFHPIKSGLVANYLSHRRAWQMAVDGSDRWTAVFEDDVRLADDINDVLAAIAARDPDAGIVRIETTLRRVVVDKTGVPLVPGRAIHRMWSWHGGVAGYVIHRDCARALLDHGTPGAADQMLFHPLSPLFPMLRVHQLVPGAAVQAAILDPAGTSAANATTVWTQEARGRGTVFRHRPDASLRWLGIKGLTRIKRLVDRCRPGRSYRFIAFERSPGEG